MPVDVGARLSFDYARFVRVQRAYGPSFSPNGRRIAFVADIIGVPQVFAVPPVGGWPQQLTFTPERIGSVHFSPVADEMIVVSDVGGDERLQLQLVSANGEVMRPLTTDLSAIHYFGGWSRDGRAIAYVSNERDSRCFDIYVRDIDADAPRRVLETDGQCQVDAFSPDGRRLLVSRVDSSANTDLYELEIATGRLRHLSPHDGDARFARATYAPDGRAVLLLTDRDTDRAVLARLDLSSLRLETLADLGWDVEDFSTSPDGRLIAYHVNVEGYSELHVRELVGRATRRVQVPDGVIARGFVGNWHDTLTWSPGGNQIAFSLTTPRRTQQVWLAELALGRAQPLTQATQAGIPADELVDPKLVRYRSFDEREIPAFLYTPRGGRADRSRPAIVLIHGGPASQIRPGFDPTIQYFVHRGYVVLAPNVRGSSGYGKAYMALDDVDKRMDSVADANAGAQWLAAQGWADARRIAAMGQSYGGFMVLACLWTAPDTWAAGVDLYGIANFVSFMEKTHPSRRRHRALEYGSLELHRDLLARISPINHVEKIKAPVLAVHGEQDMRVPIGETEQIVGALRARGVLTQLIRLPDEGHGLVKLNNRLRVYPAIADFLDRHLGGTQSANAPAEKEAETG